MPPHKAVDYSKWDLIDDEDEPPSSGQGASSAPSTLAKQRSGAQPSLTDRERQANHTESMRLIADWAKEAYPRMPSENVNQLMKFITLQHRGIHRDNTPRATEITAFLEAADAAAGEVDARSEDDLMHALLALGHMCSKRASNDASADEKNKAYRVLTVVQGALNTLWAARVEGGARALFAALHKEPEGPMASRYRALEYAADALRTPPEDPRDRPPPEPTFMTKLGRAVFVQMGIGLLSSVLIGIMFAIVLFLDPEGKTFNGPLMQVMMGRDASTAMAADPSVGGAALSAGVGSAEASAWHSVRFE